MPTDPSWLPGISYDQDEARIYDSLMAMGNGSALGSRGGVRPGDPGLTVSLAGSVINVSAGVGALHRSGRGLYRGYLGTSTSPGSVAAAHATFARIDLVYFRVWDTAVDSSGLNKGDVVYLQGTASGSPVAPTPGATEIYIPLATISVPASGGGSPSVSTAIRPYTVAPGGVLPCTTATAPSTGGPGQIMYYTDTEVFWYFKADGTTKAVLLDSAGASTIGKAIYARKTADTTRASTTAYSADPHLTVAVLANAVYEVEALILYSADADRDMKAAWSGPASSSMQWVGHNLLGFETGAAADNLPIDGQVLGDLGYQAGGRVAGSNTEIATMTVRGILITAGSAGSLTFRWAQIVSGAVGTIVRSGSYVKVTRIS